MEDAPVFYPSLEDMDKPFEKYIESIEERAQSFGICKIVAPEGWKPRAEGYENLDSHVIPKPIKQHVTGTKGIFRATNVESKTMNVGEFKKLCLSPENQPPSRCNKEDREDLERTFWKNITHSPPLYGADGVGTLFDDSIKHWNVANLNTLLTRKSKEVGVSIPGVTTPYLYFGMWRSFFAWHTEDVDLHSVNYLHFGAPKSWFTIPSAHRERFERLLQGLAPQIYRSCPQFLRHKEILVTPQLLQSNNIPIIRIVQQPREFIVNFPGVYHSGFNQGFNCAESTNFATQRWVEVGAKAKACNCKEDSVRIDMSLFGVCPLPPRGIRDVELREPGTPDGTAEAAHPRSRQRVVKRRRVQTGQLASKEALVDQWVQCESCDKWRLLHPEVASAFLAVTEHFHCRLLENTTCRTPQFPYDEEVEDVVMTGVKCSAPNNYCATRSRSCSSIVRDALFEQATASEGQQGEGLDQQITPRTELSGNEEGHNWELVRSPTRSLRIVLRRKGQPEDYSSGGDVRGSELQPAGYASMASPCPPSDRLGISQTSERNTRLRARLAEVQKQMQQQESIGHNGWQKAGSLKRSRGPELLVDVPVNWSRSATTAPVDCGVQCCQLGWRHEEPLQEGYRAPRRSGLRPREPGACGSLHSSRICVRNWHAIPVDVDKLKPKLPPEPSSEFSAAAVCDALVNTGSEPLMEVHGHVPEGDVFTKNSALPQLQDMRAEKVAGIHLAAEEVSTHDLMLPLENTGLSLPTYRIYDPVH